MNSPFANLYNSLMAKILTITAGSPAASIIRYIDLDYGQLERKERPDVDFPCILVDFTNWDFTDLSGNIQSASGNIVLKLATDPYDETSSLTPEDFRKAGIAILDLEWRLYRLLHTWKAAIVYAEDGTTITQEAQPMVRRNITSDNRRPGLKVRVLTFGCSFTDFSAKIQMSYAPVTPVITEQIVLTTTELNEPIT